MIDGFIIVLLIGFGVFSSMEPVKKHTKNVVSTKPITQVAIGFSESKKKYQLMPENLIEKPTAKTFPAPSKAKSINKNYDCPSAMALFIPFKVNSYLVQQDDKNTLSVGMKKVIRCGYNHASIYGFASPDGVLSRNIVLAKNRALSVKSLLSYSNNSINFKVINPMGGSEIKRKEVVLIFTKKGKGNE